MSTSTNSFLRNQRKTDLLELAQAVGLNDTDGMKKYELEVALDEYLAENSIHYSHHPKAAPYYQARTRARGSPVKKEPASSEPRKRQTAKAAEQAIAASTVDSSFSFTAATPGRALALARRVPLPASPADLARVVDERTLALRLRVAEVYEESGFKKFMCYSRDTLSTVNSIILCIKVFELYHLRKEILSNRYAFTIPAIPAIGTPDYAVEVPDMFLLLNGSFWNPALLWAFTSVLVPAFFGFHFNLAAAHTSGGRRRKNSFVIDPLTFSVAKAVMTYVVYQQGASFGGWVDAVSVARINSAIYGGWKGVMTGALISAIASFYDAVLRK